LPAIHASVVNSSGHELRIERAGNNALFATFLLPSGKGFSLFATSVVYRIDDGDVYKMIDFARLDLDQVSHPQGLHAGCSFP
jgi:hypothetical protein